MKKYKNFLLVFMLWSASGAAVAQINNRFFYDRYETDTSSVRCLKSGLDVMPFIKNNEYFNPIVEGYTLFGYQFKPYLSLYPSEHLRIDAGAYMLRDFGGRRFRQIEPYFMLKYNISHFSLIFGDVEGTLTHGLIEPLYDFERVIHNRMEEGLQMLWRSEKLHADVWLNWENFIQLGDHGQEIFNAGMSLSYEVVQSGDLTLKVPVQAIARHHGGQINISNAPVYTVYNFAAGIDANYKIAAGDILKFLDAEVYYSGYSGEPLINITPFSAGHGFLGNLTAGTRYCDLILTYWYGHGFYAPIGTPVYQSVSFTYPLDNFSETDRSLLFFRVAYERKLTERLSLAFRFEPVYDLINSHWDHSESLYLRFRTDWHLLNL